MHGKPLLLYVWNKDVPHIPGGLASLSHSVNMNKSIMHLFLFTKEPMLYFFRGLEFADEILELCDISTWNTVYGYCRCTALPVDTELPPEEYLIEGLKEKGHKVILHVQS